MPADPKHTYPRISKTLGEVPRELTAKAHQLSGPDLGFELGFEEDQYDPEDLRSFENDDFLDEEGGENFEGFDEEKF